MKKTGKESLIDFFKQENLTSEKIKEFKEYFKEDIDINAPLDNNKLTALHYICKQKNLSYDMLIWAIDEGKANQFNVGPEYNTLPLPDLGR